MYEVTFGHVGNWPKGDVVDGSIFDQDRLFDLIQMGALTAINPTDPLPVPFDTTSQEPVTLPEPEPSSEIPED